jgi:anaerobic ribonucleoside-triphosphate reductase activating protein
MIVAVRQSDTIQHGFKAWQSMLLRVYRIKDRCRTLGPGERAVVWFQGCSLRCPGCIAYEMNLSSTFDSMSPQLLAARLMAIDGIEGITLTGGDPFDQPRDLLAEFLECIRQGSDLSVMCYTGRTFDQLTVGEDAGIHRRILQHVDVLVDGPYVEELNEGHKWRGSANQRIFLLTDRYRALEAELAVARERTLEFELTTSNELYMSGIPPRGFMRRFVRQLDARGVVLQLGGTVTP